MWGFGVGGRERPVGTQWGETDLQRSSGKERPAGPSGGGRKLWRSQRVGTRTQGVSGENGGLGKSTAGRPGPVLGLPGSLPEVSHVLFYNCIGESK